MILSLIGSAYVFIASWYMREQQLEANRVQLQAQIELNYALNSLLNDTEFGYAVVAEDGRVVEWNTALEHITGWTKAEVIASKNGIEDVMYSDKVEEHRAAFTAAFAEERKRRKAEAVSGKKNLKPTIAILDCKIPPHGDKKEPLELRITTRIVGEETLYAIAHVDFPKLINILHIDEVSASPASQ